MSRLFRIVIVLLLGGGCFGLATSLQPRATAWSERGGADNVLRVLLGDGRRLFANHFFVKADVSVPEDCYRLAAATLERFGSVNGLVNSAAQPTAARFWTPAPSAGRDSSTRTRAVRF